MERKLASRWSVTPAQARQIQLGLRDQVELRDRLGPVQRVAGADVAIDLKRGRAIGGVVVYRFPELEELERFWAERPLAFPYIPGLLSFREMPVLLDAFERLHHEPDLVFYDGHGYAHPRRFGITCHLGLALDRPTIGCAKSRLIGACEEPPAERGGWTPLIDQGEVIGAVVRTRAAVKPIYVSQGHRVSLETAIELTLAVTGLYRVPRPTRDADHFVGVAKHERNAARPLRADGKGASQ